MGRAYWTLRDRLIRSERSTPGTAVAGQVVHCGLVREQLAQHYLSVAVEEGASVQVAQVCATLDQSLVRVAFGWDGAAAQILTVVMSLSNNSRR